MPKITALKSLASPHWGASSSCLRTIYQTLIRPTIDYGAPAWFPSLAPSNLRPLSSIHHAACRAISGCLRSSPIDLLCSEARLPPLDTHLKIQCGKYFEKALRLPDNNPVKHTLQNTAPQRLRTQQSLQTLARPISQSAGLADTPRVPLHPCSAVPPWSSPLPIFRPALSNPCSRTDPPDVRLRAAVATLSSLPSPDVELWTDGSVGPGGGGSGCFAICHLCDSKSSLTVPSGSHSSSFQAELIAIREALTWLRLHSQSCQPSCVHLCSDSLSCVTLLESGPEASRCAQLQDVWRLLSELTHIPSFIFQWVPSHCGLPHNEMADSLASRAATLSQTGIPLPFNTACARISRHLSCQWRSSVTSSLLTGPLHACQTHQPSPDPSVQRSLSSAATATPLFFVLTYTASGSLLRLPASIAAPRTMTSTTSFCFAPLLTLNVFDILVLFPSFLCFGRKFSPSLGCHSVVFYEHRQSSLRATCSAQDHFSLAAASRYL